MHDSFIQVGLRACEHAGFNAQGYKGWSLSGNPEDFIVREWMNKPETLDDAPHTWLEIEKEGSNTLDVVKALAKSLNFNDRDIGFAGRKDKNARTCQWLSIPLEKKSIDVAQLTDALASCSARLLRYESQAKKLKLGQLLGNHFEIRLSLESERVRQRAHDFIKEYQRQAKGQTLLVPNFFGPQRFGKEFSGLFRAWNKSCDGTSSGETGDLKGGANEDSKKRTPRKQWLSKFEGSVLQSTVFNAWLSKRIHDHGYAGLLEGELHVGNRYASDAILRGESHKALEPYDATGPQILEQRRLPAGPLLGAKTLMPTGLGMTKLSELCTLMGIAPANPMIAKWGRGDVRAAFIAPLNLSLAMEGTTLRASFSLFKGAYATTVIAWLLGTEHYLLCNCPFEIS